MQLANKVIIFRSREGEGGQAVVAGGIGRVVVEAGGEGDWVVLGRGCSSV